MKASKTVVENGWCGAMLLLKKETECTNVCTPCFQSLRYLVFL